MFIHQNICFSWNWKKSVTIFDKLWRGWKSKCSSPGQTINEGIFLSRRALLTPLITIDCPSFVSCSSGMRNALILIPTPEVGFIFKHLTNWVITSSDLSSISSSLLLRYLSTWLTFFKWSWSLLWKYSINFLNFVFFHFFDSFLFYKLLWKLKTSFA